MVRDEAPRVQHVQGNVCTRRSLAKSLLAMLLTIIAIITVATK